MSSFRALLILATSLLAFNLLTAISAQAALVHRFESSFSLPNSGTPLEQAVNESTGEVYVIDDSYRTVEAFEASGAPDPIHPQLTKVDGTTPFPFNFPYGITVDNTHGPNNGDIYVADYSGALVAQFDPSGARTATPQIGALNVPKEGTAQPGGLPPVLNNRGFSPTGVAVGPDGNIYVADQSNNVVDLFEPNGTFISQLAAGHISGPNAIALAPSGDLYVAQNGSGLVEFEPSGACVNSCVSVDPSANLGVATDPEGNVYADEGSAITEFNSSGEQVDRFGEGLLSFGRGIAFNDANGDVYVADEGAGKVEVFKQITAPTVTTGKIENPGQISATLTGLVDPDTAHSGGGPVTTCDFEYGTDTSYSLGSEPCLNADNEEVGTSAKPLDSPTEVHAGLTGLSTLTTYHYRLAASNANDVVAYTADRTFELQPALPVVHDTSSSDVTPTTATLSAHINPGSGITVYRFQYGTTKSYGSSTLIGPAGSDDTDHVVTADVAGLTPATTYHYRGVAINYAGTTQGPDLTFTTPDLPAVGGDSATKVTSTTATLEAQVNPEFATTTYHFQYGPSTSYGLNTLESAPVGADDTSHAVGTELTGLNPATLYHFRIVATNPLGSTSGVDESFTTDAAPPGTGESSAPCGKGYAKKHGKCVKHSHHKPRHHKRGGRR